MAKFRFPKELTLILWGAFGINSIIHLFIYKLYNMGIISLMLSIFIALTIQMIIGSYAGLLIGYNVALINGWLLFPKKKKK